MSEQKFALKAELRHDLGKGASRRLRRLGNLVPAIIYGGTEDPLSIMLAHDEVVQALSHESTYSHILSLNVAGRAQSVVIKDLQRHPFKPRILHMDFQRVSATESIHMHIPLHFIGEDTCPGTKAGGVVSHQMTEVEVRCLAKDLPEFLEVDLSEAALDSNVHLSELNLPHGVELMELVHNNDRVVSSIHRPKVAQADAEAEAAAAEAAAATETKAKAKDK
jgi:large subunit ribosomal protein L25